LEAGGGRGVAVAGLQDQGLFYLGSLDFDSRKACNATRLLSETGTTDKCKQTVVFPGSLATRVTGRVCEKDRPKCTPSPFLPKSMQNFHREKKEAKNVWSTSVISKNTRGK
jgi:hypothetical protein